MTSSTITPKILRRLAERLDEHGRIAAEAVAEVFAETSGAGDPVVPVVPGDADFDQLYSEAARVLGVETGEAAVEDDDGYTSWASLSGVSS